MKRGIGYIGVSHLIEDDCYEYKIPFLFME